jgi:hypothetical protein
MNSFGKAVTLMAFGCLISILFGCAPSRLVDIWHDPSFQAPLLGKMLVVAVRKDATQRRIWEDAFAGELVKHGIVATSSYTLFPDAPPDTSRVITTVQANGFDGVLVILKLPTERIKQYPSVEQDVNYTSYWQRYLTYYRDIDNPAYIDSQSVDIRKFDVTKTGSNGRLIWSATSRTPDPGTVSDVQQGIAGLVIADLAKQRIINSKKF